MGALDPIYTQAQWQRIADAIVDAAPDDHWIFENQESLVSSIDRAARAYLSADDPASHKASADAEIAILRRIEITAQAFLNAMEAGGYYEPADDRNPAYLQEVEESLIWSNKLASEISGSLDHGLAQTAWKKFLFDCCMYWTHNLGLRPTFQRDELGTAGGPFVDFLLACGTPVRQLPMWMKGKGEMTAEMAAKAIVRFQKIWRNELDPSRKDSGRDALLRALKNDIAE